jgi:adenylate cyclase
MAAAFGQPARPTIAGPRNAIAVLPFLNLSKDENGDYFSDGIAEELLNVLSKIRGLRVAARTSSFSFKGRQVTVAEIGRALNVASVLEGSIRTAGNRVRIAVQLSTVSDGYQVWSETYDRTMDDIFAVQDDIAESVVEELRVRLFNEPVGPNTGTEIESEVKEAVRSRAGNPESQRLMLLGRHFLDRTTREDTQKAIECFQKALELEPGYALCWAELGRAHSIEAGRAWIPVAEGFALSRAATDRALSLEPNLAEGHAQLGRIQITNEWDLKGAESSYHRALELDPANVSVMDGAAMLAYKLGKLDRAIELARSVLEKDPLSAAFWHNLGLIYYAAGRLEESATAFRTALEIVPQRFVSSALLALVMMDQGDVNGSLEQAALEPYDMWRLWSLAIVCHAAGKTSEADQALKQLTEEYVEGNAYQLAEVFAARGEINAAFDWLQLAYETRDSGLTHAKVNPRFRALHDDPRWADLLQKVGLN